MSLWSFLFGWRSLGIKRSDLVLEIGSGADPCIRSNVLVDRYMESKERAGQLLKVRPFVLADAHELPFSDKKFDYTLAIHLLEHLENPAKFLSELQRVSTAGYLETPSPLCEMVFGHPFHLWFVWVNDGVLTLQRKTGVNDRVCNLMNYYLIHDRYVRKFVRRHNNVFMTKFEWKGQIQFRVLDTDMDSVHMFLPEQSLAQSHLANFKIRTRIKTVIQTVLGRLLR